MVDNVNDDKVLPANGESQSDAEEYARVFAETFGGKEHSVEEETGSDSASGSDDASPKTKVRSDGAEESSSASDDGKGEPKELPDPDAWISELPEDVRQQAAALQQKERTSAGRASALQRRLNKLQARLDAREELKSKGRKSDASADEDEDDPASLQEFMEKYPSLAKSVQSLVRQQAADLEEAMESRYGPLYEEMRASKRVEAQERLEKGAAELFETDRTGINYKDVIESDVYVNEFLPSQPAEFQRIATTTSDPDTALWVLKQFKEFADERGSKQDANPGSQNTTSRADQVSDRRNQNRRTAGTVQPRSAMTDIEQDVGYEAEFRRQWGGGKR